ncbi:Zinc metalloprotease [hydrothermal vent metagenome]|uniref:Zinc metalloprotease n=1 Tax=hydrothermal vent metagenome TaxID=652676 RepID=A0A3B0UF13_9ZZZZ
MVFKRQKIPEETLLEVDGSEVLVQICLSKRSKRYRLSIPHSGVPLLSMPQNGRWPEAEKFLQKQRAWLGARLKRTPAPVPFVDGAKIVLRGDPAQIMATGKLRGQVEISNGENMPILSVPGGPKHMARRLTDWLKIQALGEFEARTKFHAARLNVTPKSVKTRTQSSRWGSCSSSGRLNYNWRLILAPPFVLDYVVAHEVAHLSEMNHSPAFWARVKQTLPEMERGRAWLKDNGNQLMAYGLAARCSQSMCLAGRIDKTMTG